MEPEQLKVAPVDGVQQREWYAAVRSVETKRLDHPQLGTLVSIGIEL